MIPALLIDTIFLRPEEIKINRKEFALNRREIKKIMFAQCSLKNL